MIFVDSGPFLARYLAKDAFHERALEVWPSLTASRLFTSNHVLAESLTLIGRRASYSIAAECGERLYGSERLEIIFSDREDETAALRLFRKFADQKVSFTDCVSFALMRQLGIETAFTFDRHFLQAGFRVIGVKP
jgi:predicted nucleic acid-binding protein